MNRRQFLQRSAAALAFAALPSYAADLADTKKRVGLIGCGWYGKIDLLRLIQVAPVEVVSLCDVDSNMLSDAAEIVATQLIKMMKATGIPNGVGGVGYGEADVPGLTKGAWAQQRLLTNAPRDISEMDLSQLYRGAMRYW